MKKSKRYRLTEEQLKPVIRFINEDSPYYPAGVTDSNFDRLSGANEDEYTAIIDVENDVENGDLVLTVKTQHGQKMTKRLSIADNNFILQMDEELRGIGVNPDTEWEIESAEIRGHELVLAVMVNNQEYPVTMSSGFILELLPVAESEDYDDYDSEPDFDAMYQQHQER